MPLKKSTKASTSRQELWRTFRAWAQATALFFLPRQRLAPGTMTKQQTFFVALERPLIRGKEAQTTLDCLGRRSTVGHIFLSFLVSSFLNFSTPFIYFLGEAINMLFNFMKGSRGQNFLSERFLIPVCQAGGRPREGGGKRTAGVDGGTPSVFLAGQHTTLGFLSDNTFVNKHLLSNIRVSTIINRVLITCCFIRG